MIMFSHIAGGAKLGGAVCTLENRLEFQMTLIFDLSKIV